MRICLRVNCVLRLLSEFSLDLRKICKAFQTFSSFIFTKKNPNLTFTRNTRCRQISALFQDYGINGMLIFSHLLELIFYRKEILEFQLKDDKNKRKKSSFCRTNPSTCPYLCLHKRIKYELYLQDNECDNFTLWLSFSPVDFFSS